MGPSWKVLLETWPHGKVAGGAAVMLSCRFRAPHEGASASCVTELLTELFSHLRAESHSGFPVPSE